MVLLISIINQTNWQNWENLLFCGLKIKFKNWPLHETVVFVITRNCMLRMTIYDIQDFVKTTIMLYVSQETTVT